MANTIDLFGTVPDEDVLCLMDNPKRTRDFLNLGNEELAQITGVPKSSIRFDDEKRIPAEIKARLNEWAVLLNLVAGFFNKDPQKTTIWFAMPNPMLGDYSPRDMIRYGNARKLHKFIVQSLTSNKKTP